jgi:hypothetical protein
MTSTHAPRQGGQRSPSRMWERTLAGGGKLACTLAVWGVSGAGRVSRERKELFSQFEKFCTTSTVSNGDERAHADRLF